MRRASECVKAIREGEELFSRREPRARDGLQYYAHLLVYTPLELYVPLPFYSALYRLRRDRRIVSSPSGLDILPRDAGLHAEALWLETG